jgi:ubiquinone/menaquinone biosynthesis C-methylase UbiE
MDVWLPSAITGNQSNSVLQNAQIEQVSDRVESKQGDARNLPFPDAVVDAVVSNFVVHELRTPAERQQMMREIARMLKPGGHVTPCRLHLYQRMCCRSEDARRERGSSAG